jgi:hypothetical protein
MSAGPFHDQPVLRDELELSARLNTREAATLRAWLAKPDGSYTASSRITFEAASDGGILVRIWRWTP